MKKLISLVLVLVLSLALLVACGSNNAQNQTGSNQAQTNDVIDNRSEETAAPDEEESASAESPANVEVKDEDFEIKEYLYDGKYDSYYYLVVKNNSTISVDVSGNATAKDSNGNAIGAGNLSIDVIGPGQTSVGYFYFDDVHGIATVDYSLNYGTDPYYEDVLADLSFSQTINNSNVIVSAVNNGTEAAEFVEAYALFFDANGTVVDTDSAYLTDNDYELKPGATLSAQLNTNEAFDHVEVYLTGRRDK